MATILGQAVQVNEKDINANKSPLWKHIGTIDVDATSTSAIVPSSLFKLDETGINPSITYNGRVDSDDATIVVKATDSTTMGGAVKIGSIIELTISAGKPKYYFATSALVTGDTIASALTAGKIVALDSTFTNVFLHKFTFTAGITSLPFAFKGYRA